jgi:hypothetical protein
VQSVSAQWKFRQIPLAATEKKPAVGGGLSEKQKIRRQALGAGCKPLPFYLRQPASRLFFWANLF